MPLILPGNVASATAATTYSVANSCLFNDDDSAKLTLTPGSTSDAIRQKWTFSCWFKIGNLGAQAGNRAIIFPRSDGSNYAWFYLNSSDQLLYNEYRSSTDINLITNRKFRDPSAWYHLVVATDTTQGTAANRVKIYINGVQETSFATETYPAQDFVTMYNSDALHTIGNDDGSSLFDGYLAEMVMVTNSQLAPTSFGEFDEDSPTIWKPIDVSGLTFGTNGFYLDFEASDNLGNDASGGTDWTETNLAAIDQATDTPTNNFATLNPLTPNALTVSQGNLHVVGDSVDYRSLFSTLGVANGKWYVELKFLALEGGVPRGAIGMVDATDMTLMATNQVGYNITGTVGDSIGYAGAGTSDNIKKNSSNVADGTTWSVDDIICMAVDCDNGAVYFRENDDAWLNSGDPTSGASRTGGITFTVGETYVLGGTAYGSSTQWDFNYGNPPYANSSSVADADGYGAFEFAPPSGYFAMCTKNLAEYG